MHVLTKQTYDSIVQAIVKRLPKRVIYFAVIRAWSLATTGKNSHKVADSVTPKELLEAVE